jgi:hypothetical protein
MRNTLIVHFLLVIMFTGVIYPSTQKPDEESTLVSYAQDIYRQNGVNMARNAFDLIQIKGQDRIFYIKLLSRTSTLSDDLLQAFLVGGAISQHARLPIDLIIIDVELEFSQKPKMILQASGQCCENLYNTRMTTEAFTEGCLKIK